MTFAVGAGAVPPKYWTDTHHAAMPLIDDLTDRLLETTNPDGGWGAHPGGPSATETTALALLALHAARPDARIPADRARAWLHARQREDGSWPATDAVPESSWMTSIAVLALTRADGDPDRAIRGARWLLGQEGRRFAWYVRLIYRLFPENRAVELDLDLVGWPWAEGSFSWIEPTAHALIGLKALRDRLPQGRTAERIERAERLVFDRICPGGGWNYGNSRVLGEDLWPYPDTTAWALIAIRDLPLRAGTEQSLAALDALLAETESGLALALAVLCFDLYGRPRPDLRDRLDRAWRETRFLQRTRTLALAALATAGTDLYRV